MTSLAAPSLQISMPDLLLASAMPVAKVALLCGVGAWCSWQGILTAQGRRVLSGLTFNVFVPCLHFEKLAEFSFADVALLWPLSANMVLSHVVGAGVGLAMLAASRAPRELARHLLLCTSVGNVGNLPLVLVDSLAAGPGLALLGPSAHRGLQYVMVSNIAASFIQFPLVKFMLQSCDSSASTTGGRHASSRATTAPPVPDGSAPGAHLRSKLRECWQAVATPPIVATIAALCTGQLPAARHLLFSQDGSLKLVGEVTTMLGGMAIPALMLVLGANLANGPGSAAVPSACVAAVAVGRLVLLPLAGTALVAACAKAGWLNAMGAKVDPTVLVVMMMMNAMPTALMIHNVATLYDNRQDDVAVIMFYQYLAAMLTLPLFMTLFLRTAAALIAI